MLANFAFAVGLYTKIILAFFERFLRQRLGVF
jgi:hypothetical protein